MSESRLCQFVEFVLDDDNGISEESYQKLTQLAWDYPQVVQIIEKVKACDGRYYLPNKNSEGV